MNEYKEKIIDSFSGSRSQAQKTLSAEKIVVLGYGIQGRAQALNLRDQGFHVSVGQRKSSVRWQKACEEGWVAGENLFPIDQSFPEATLYLYLLSDAGQVQRWPQFQTYLKPNKTLCLAHGFILAYPTQTHVKLPPKIDALILAPKGSGISLREKFIKKEYLNAGYVILQDTSGKSTDKLKSLSLGIGTRYLFPTTLTREVYADLTGERGTLVAGIAALFESQYQVLRKHGHSPLEAFYETVEEFTQSLLPLIAEKGIAHLLANISSTAQIGFFPWKEKFTRAISPVFEELYEHVASGKEAKQVLNTLQDKDLQVQLKKRIEKYQQTEIWEVGKTIQGFRSDIQKT
ncbi:MAG: ketol-acid reductoisomerase [Cytophagales bacterium]|nr:ketol-acid reductoisomerase [Cytophagales bacterium]